MQSLVNIEAVTSQHNIKGLQRFYDSVEAQVKGLRSLGMLVGSYGPLLATSLVDKLPSELQLIISHEAHGEEWELDSLMRVLEQEIEARERAFLVFQTRLLGYFLEEAHQWLCPCFLLTPMLQNAATANKHFLQILVRWWLTYSSESRSWERLEGVLCAYDEIIWTRTLKYSRCGEKHHVTVCNGPPGRPPLMTVEQATHPQPPVTSTAKISADTRVTLTTSSLYCVSTKTADHKSIMFLGSWSE